MGDVRVDIREFAALMAALERPFSDRAGTLLKWALDESSLTTLVSTWRARMTAAAEKDSEMAEQYARAYAASSDTPAGRSSPAVQDPRPLPPGLEVTAEMPGLRAQAGPALPFAPPPPGVARPPPEGPPVLTDLPFQPAQADSLPPRKRLLRFDPRTGQPLPQPIWMDMPPEPEKK